MTFLLDTNAISQAVRNPTGPVARHADARRLEVATSVLVLAEIRFGAQRQPDSKIGKRALRYVAALPLMLFDEQAAIHYGQIAAHMERHGHGIAPMDALIAAHARSVDAVLITNNTAHFTNVPGLAIEDWQQAAAEG